MVALAEKLGMSYREKKKFVPNKVCRNTALSQATQQEIHQCCAFTSMLGHFLCNLIGLRVFPKTSFLFGPHLLPLFQDYHCRKAGSCILNFVVTRCIWSLLLYPKYPFPKGEFRVIDHDMVTMTIMSNA